MRHHAQKFILYPIRLRQLPGQALHLVIELGILDRDGRLTGDGHEKRDLLTAKEMPRSRIKTQDSEHFPFGHQRDAQVRN